MPQIQTKLRLGDHAPDFTLKDISGHPHQLNTLLASAPLVLVFFRGTWCGTCRAYMRMLEHRLPRIKASGLQLVGIAHQRADIVAGYFRLEPVNYLYLLDTERRVIDSYGLSIEHPEEEDVLKSGTSHTTYPAVFILDHAGLIRWEYIGEDYGDLPTGEQIEQEVLNTGLSTTGVIYLPTTEQPSRYQEG